MSSYDLETHQARIIISALEDRRDILLTKIDKVRKTRACIDDDMYQSIIQSHHLDLSFVCNIIDTFTDKI